MSIIDPKNALEQEVIRSFGGIRSHAGLESGAAADMRNFRILPDGSLEKRCGHRIQYQLPGEVRGIWEGALEGGSYLFAVVADTVYCVKPTGSAPEPIYYLTTTAGPVSLFYFVDRLYLLDGASMLFFRTNTGTFTISSGYVPLYGENWDPADMGSVKEPLNLVNNSIRLHYLNTSGATEFRLPYTMKSLDRVKVNGSFVTNYSFVPYSSTFRLPAGSVGTVEVGATLDDIFSRRSAVLRCSCAEVYKDPHHETLLTWGGAPGYNIYRTAHLTAAQLSECTGFYGNTDPVYFPDGASFRVGSVQHPVTSVCQDGDQALVMNDQSLWAIRHTADDSDEAYITLIDSGIGCCSPDAAIPCGGQTATVWETGVALLHFAAGRPDDCTVEVISGDIANRLSPDTLLHARLFWRKSTDELWVFDPTDQSGLFWVYSLSGKHWVCHAIVPSAALLEQGGELLLCTRSGKILISDPTLYSDDGVLYEAWYQSHYLCFSHPWDAKRALRASLCGNAREATLEMRLESERGEKRFSATAQERNADYAPVWVDRRVSFGRFRFLRYRLVSGGEAPAQIYFLSLAAE